MKRSPRLGVLVAMLAVAPLVYPAGGATAAASASAWRGSLKGETTIEWSGRKGFVFEAMPKQVFLPEENVELYLTKGTVATVVIVARNLKEHTCQDGSKAMGCGAWFYQIIRDLVETHDDFPPGWIHTMSVPDPPSFSKDAPIDVYLFTDGEAKLVLHPTNRSGTASYRATGRIGGRIKRLPIRCPTDHCDTERGYGPYEVGGASYDLGKEAGLTLVSAYVDPIDPEINDRGNFDQLEAEFDRVCHYPNPRSPNASPSPKDHPWGCDLVAEDSTNADEWDVVAWQTATSVNGGVGRWPYEWNPVSRGKVYLGYHVGAVGPNPVVRGAYGLWTVWGIKAP